MEINERTPLATGAVNFGRVKGTTLYYSGLIPFVRLVKGGALDFNGHYFITIGWFAEFNSNGQYSNLIKDAIESQIPFTLCLNSPQEYEAFRASFSNTSCCILSELFFFYLRHDFGNIFSPSSKSVEKQYQAVLASRKASYKNRDFASGISSLACVIPNQFHLADVTLPNPKYVNKKFMSRSEINQIFAQSEVGLILSFREGANRTTLEYLLSGLPIVSTQCEGGRELFLDDQNSITVPFHSDRDAYARKIASRVDFLCKQRRDGLFSPLVIRSRALRHLRWHYEQFNRVVSEAVKAPASIITEELKREMVNHTSSAELIINCESLKPTFAPKNGYGIYIES